MSVDLAALAGLGYWGFATGVASFAKVALAAGPPLLAVIAWGIFGSSNAPIHLEGAMCLLLELVFFGSAAVALAAAGPTMLAASFALVVVGNIALLHALGQA